MFVSFRGLGKHHVKCIKSLSQTNKKVDAASSYLYGKIYLLQHRSTLKTSCVKPSPDLGFSKSSQVSIYPNFTPFDATTARLEATEKNTVVNLCSLLEACLTSGYLERAFSLLLSLYNVESNRKYFINDYNNYLMKYCQSGVSIKEVKEKLYNDFEHHFIECRFDGKTWAIMIHHTLESNLNRSEKQSHINDFLNLSQTATRSIMNKMDVLSINDYIALYRDFTCVSLGDLPEAVRLLVEKSSGEAINDPTSEKSSLVVQSEQNDSKFVFRGSEEEIKTLEKDVDSLIAVSTFGMKAVRHTLQGLALSDEQKLKLNGLVVDPLLKCIVPDKTSIDFFEMYKSLKTEDERKAFNDFLEEFNHERQRDLENRSVDAAKERWRHEFEEAKSRGDLNIKKSLNAKLWEWYSAMAPLIKEEVKHCKKLLISSKQNCKLKDMSLKDRTRLEYAPYLTLVNPDKMSVITILELLSLNSTGGVSEGMRTARAVIAIGKAVEMEFRSEALLKSENQIFKDVNKKSYELKKLVQRAKFTFRNAKIEESKVLWPYQVRAKIGSLLISILIHVAKISVKGVDPTTNKVVYGEAPAFCHTFQYRTGSKVGILKLHRSLANQLSGENLNASVQPQHLPMLVTPRPWKSWNSGGYYYTQSTLIRSKDSPEQLAYIKAVTDQGAIENVYNGLNVLGATAWTVNRKLFNVISQVWNEGKEFLDIPLQQDDFEIPKQPSRDSDPLILKQWRNECKFKNIEFRNNKSVRCDSNYKLEIARAFIGEKFYFPHNMDFRGRAYPLPPHFNHLGNDMTRSLLIFWEGKRLGPDGLKWLKIHFANLYGMDKVSFEDRIKFAEANIENIQDSAKSPLNGKGWWKKAENPWQLLATCMELSEAYKMNNPEDYISHQPVHQDGTCNGLQHYAALGGDVEGARQVNLVPSEHPQDVYAFVAKLVTERLRVAAEGGDETAFALKNLVTRKVVKRTVMTNVYGVTFVGATNQIDKELQDTFSENSESYFMARYLAKHVFASIRELFHAAHLIQDWLAESAKKISKSVRLDLEIGHDKKLDNSLMMTSVIWTSPLGLPVVQPYRDLKKRQITTNLQTVFITNPFAINPVDGRKQMAGFPPNFIHSLDASHMLLSAIECGIKGLTFAAVHDSYWTHASDIPIMNLALRTQFIKMHEIDLVQRLKDEFDERYKDYLEVKKIRKFSELGLAITELRKQFSEKLGRPITFADEILMERKRQKLLRSDNPEDQLRGKALVTTVSFLEDKDYSEYEFTNSSSCVVIMVPMKFSEIPSKGKFDLNDLANSKYFFS